MRPAQLNQTLEKKVEGIESLNERLIEYLGETLLPPTLERLSNNYDERFYCGCLNNIELVRKYFNNSVEIMNQELGFIDIETNEMLQGISNTFNSSLDLYSFETNINLFLNDLDKGIKNFSLILDTYLGNSEEIDPEPNPTPEPEPKPDPEPQPQPNPNPNPDPEPKPEPEPNPEPEPQPQPQPNPNPNPDPEPKPEESIVPEDMHWEPLDRDVVSTGYTRLFEYPVPGWGGTQGAGFDKDHYYTFGTIGKLDSSLKLAVIDKHDPDKSFVARGDIGDYTDYKNYMLGHTNDCTVMYQKGDEVTLLVSSMIPGEVATAIVNLKTQTVRYGKRIPVAGSKGEKIGAVTSSQLIDNNRVILKASSHYWVATYNETKMELVKFIKSNNASVLKIVKEKFGENYFDGIAGQSDWFENGYLYTIAWSGDWKKCVIFEMIPKGPDEWAIPSNRYWWGEEENRRFEPEKVWIENGKFMITVSMNGPYDNFIAEMHWKN